MNSYNTIEVIQKTSLSWVVPYIFMILAWWLLILIIFAIINRNDPNLVLKFEIISAVVVLVSIFLFILIAKPKNIDDYQYKIKVSEDIKEFYETYNIIETNGNIFIVEEK